MAKISFLNTDTLTQHIVKLNDLSLDIGDLASLNTAIDSDIVGAINSLITTDSGRFATIESRLDSNEANLGFKFSAVETGMGNFTVSTPGLVDSGVQYTYNGPLIAPSLGLSYDSASNTLSGLNATSSVKGVASFSSDNFLVSTGAVTIKNGGVVNDEIATNTITSNRFNNAVSLKVYDSSGSAVKTVFSPGS